MIQIKSQFISKKIKYLQILGCWDIRILRRQSFYVIVRGVFIRSAQRLCIWRLSRWKGTVMSRSRSNPRLPTKSQRSSRSCQRGICYSKLIFWIPTTIKWSWRSIRRSSFTWSKNIWIDGLDRRRWRIPPKPRHSSSIKTVYSAKFARMAILMRKT